MIKYIYLIILCYIGVLLYYTPYQLSVYRTVPMLPQFPMTLPEQCPQLPDNRRCRLVTDLDHIAF